MKYNQREITQMKIRLIERDINESEDATVFDDLMVKEARQAWDGFEDNEIVDCFEDSFGKDYFKIMAF